MEKQVQTLQQILEALMTISVKGNDVITLSNCLQTLNRTIGEVRDAAEALAAAPEPEPVVEPEIVE